MQALTNNFSIQLCEGITLRGIKVEVIEEGFYLLLLNYNSRNFDNIFLEVFNNNIDNFINLCDLNCRLFFCK